MHSADPLRQRACCELVALLTADGTGVMSELAASLQAPPEEGADGAGAAAADFPAADGGRCASSCCRLYRDWDTRT